jgi:hypothetical protein
VLQSSELWVEHESTGTTGEFLGLKAEETTLVNMRLSLAEKLRGRRTKLGLSQTGLAA